MKPKEDNKEIVQNESGDFLTCSTLKEFLDTPIIIGVEIWEEITNNTPKSLSGAICFDDTDNTYKTVL